MSVYINSVVYTYKHIRLRIHIQYELKNGHVSLLPPRSHPNPTTQNLAPTCSHPLPPCSNPAPTRSTTFPPPPLQFNEAHPFFPIVQ